MKNSLDIKKNLLRVVRKRKKIKPNQAGFFDQEEGVTEVDEFIKQHTQEVNETYYSQWLNGFLELYSEDQEQKLMFINAKTKTKRWLTVKEDCRIPNARGKDKMLIIVPEGISVTFPENVKRSHNNIFFMSGFKHVGKRVLIFKDSFD